MAEVNTAICWSLRLFEKVEVVAYQIMLSLSLSSTYDAFHVSQLRKYVADPSHVIPRDDV